MMKRQRTCLIIGMLLGAALFLAFGQAGSDVHAAETRAGDDVQNTFTLWDSMEAYKGTDPMDGTAVGDALPDHPGNEIVTVSRDGNTYLSRFDEASGAFLTETIWETPGQQLTPVIGDLKPGNGNEILSVGLATGMEDDATPGNGTATVLTYSGGVWVPERAYTGPKLVHGADIGDLDPNIPGNEAVITTFSFEAYLLWWDTNSSEWKTDLIYNDSHNIRKVVIADILPERPGNEMVAISRSGNVTLAYGTVGNWTVERIHKSVPLARVAVGDIDGDGQLEIYLCGDKIDVGGGVMEAEVYGLKRSGNDWVKEVIYTEDDSLRGVWVGDVDPNVPGPELYSFGWGRELVQHTGFFGSGWSSKLLFTDTARGHEIRIGDVIPSRPGPEIVIVGYSATVNVVFVSDWENVMVYKGTDPMDGTAVGDALPDHPGNEIVTVSRDGNTYLSRFDEASGAFLTETIWETPGQQLTPVIGDLKPGNGNEILSVGLATGMEDDATPGNGTATVLTYSGGVWVPERAYTGPKLVHGADIGDLDPNIPGNEAVITTFSFEAYLLWWDTNSSEWKTDLIYNDSHNIRKVVIADILPERPGNEMVAISRSGNVTLAYGTVGNWTVERIHKSVPLARVAVGDIDGDGQLEIYLCGDKIDVGGGVMEAEVYGLKRSGNDWVKEVIYTEDDSLRGVWVGDVDPNVPGPELYSFGWGRELVQHTGFFGSGWSSKLLFTDTARGHEIRIGDVIPSRPGPEIVIVGYSATVNIVGLKELGEDNEISVSGSDTLTVASGGTGSVDLSIAGDGLMTITASEPSGLSVKVVPGTLFLTGKARIEVTALPTNEDGEHDITITVKGVSLTETFVITVSVTGDKVAPTVSSAMSGGSALQEGSELPGDARIVLTFSKGITPASFEAARTAGHVSLKRGTDAIAAQYELSADGLTLTIQVNDTVGGDASLSVSGLKDIAGNDITAYSLGLKFIVGAPTADITIGPILSDGTPISGASIAVTKGSAQRTGTTGADGKAVINVPAEWVGETVNIKVTLSGYDELTTEGTIGADLSVTTEKNLILVETEGEDPTDPDYTWIILVIVAIVIMIVVVIIVVLLSKGKKEEPEAKEE